MKKFMRVSLIVSAVLILSGILLAITGVLFGASKSISYGADGIEFDTGEDYHYESKQIDNIEHIKVNVENAKVEVLPSDGDYYKVEINLSDSTAAPDVTFTDSTINIYQEREFKIFSMDFDFFTSENIIKIYVPENEDMDKINIETSNGSINITQELEVNELNIDTSNGKIQINGMVCENKANVKSSNGSIVCNGTFMNSTELKTSNGKIEISGKFYGNTYCKTSNGSVTVKLDEKETAYDVEADTSNGSVYVDDRKVSDEYSTNNSSENDLEVKTSNGSIRLYFKK